MNHSTNLKALVVISVIFLVSSAKAQTIWTGPPMTFTKANYTDWTNSANQDRITDNVWLTRKDAHGLFNIAQEPGYGGSSPVDTEWAYGSAVNWQALTFKSWVEWHNWTPPTMVGQDAVLHLITDDIYIDIKFLSWTVGGVGGGFSYERSTPGLYYVDANSSPGGDGLTWETAFSYLQDALAVARAGDDIYVADGNYTPDSNSLVPGGTGDRNATFQLKSDVNVEGGYAGYGSAGPNARDIQLYKTILSGDIGIVDDNSDNSYHVVTADNVNSNSFLDGFTITAGSSTFTVGSQFNGAGIKCLNSSPVITNCIITDNLANTGGGGISCTNSSPVISDCTISNNFSNEVLTGGGGIYCVLNSSPTITNCSIIDNETDDGCGAGISCRSSSSPVITNCTIMGNRSIEDPGGGIYCKDNSNPMITNCLILNNETLGYKGAGIYCSNSSPEITNCLITRNSTSDRGGAIYCDASSPKGVSNPIITNCTIIANEGLDAGGGIYCNLVGVAIENCILWDNIDNNGSGESSQLAGSTPYINHSCVMGWSGALGGIGNIGADPCFVDANGPDDIIGTEDDNLRLSWDSPCIDTGDNNSVPSGLTTDLDGRPRIIDGDSNDTEIVDMGAYEYGYITFYVDVNTPDSNDGSSWDKAYMYLQDALAKADPCDEIWVAEGTYKPNHRTRQTPGDRAATFQLKNDVAIYGGYAGYGAPDPNARDIQLYETILSGDLDGNDVQVDPCDLLDEPTRAENSYHVVTGSDTDSTAIIDGFTIIAGNANGSDPHGSGGGMYNYLGGPTVTNCTFSNNSAYAGGGMYNDSNSPTVTNCTFTGNSAAQDGGGMNNENSSPVVSNCVFIGNATEDGGGMCNANSSPTVTNCTFNGNSAISPDVYVLGGGGMCNVEYSSPTLTNCILWGNTAPEPNGPQIALKDNSTVSISYCDLQGGQAAIYNDETSSIIWAAGNIDDDPLFVDSNNGNLHLRSISPCIEAGDPIGDYSGQVDMDAEERLSYDRVDIGADEVSPIAGDIDWDEDVDMSDLGFFMESWLEDCFEPFWCQRRDFDTSGKVDFRDFAYFAQHWLAGIP